MTDDAVPDVDEAAPTGGRQRLVRSRRVITWVFVVLLAVMMPLSVMAVWVITTVTNTDQYVTTMAPLARNEIVTDQVARRATTELFSSVNVQGRIAQTLPAKASFLAPQLSNGLEGFVQQNIAKLLRQPWFSKLWDSANRRVHQKLVSILSGEGGPGVKVLRNGDQVVVNLSPVLLRAVNAADSKGITVFDGLKPVLSTPNGRLSISLVSSEQVAKVSGLFNFVKTLRWVIPLVVLALIGAVLGIATDRRRAMLRSAIGAAIATAVFLGGLALGRGIFIQKAVGADANGQVAGIVWDTMLRMLRADLRWMLLLLVVVAALLWVLGPARYAISTRSHVVAAARWVGRRSAALMSPARRSQVSAGTSVTLPWMLDHRTGLRLAGVVVAGLVVVFGGNLSAGALLATLVVLAVYLGIVQLLLMWAATSSGGSAAGASDPQERSQPRSTS